MKQFNLEEYLKNPERKVVTRDRHPVRIICTDHDNISYPIVGAIKGYDFPFCFSEDGYVVGSKCNDANDLFFASEKHEVWINIYKNTSDYVFPSHIFKTKEEAEETGKECMGYITTSKIEWEEQIDMEYKQIYGQTFHSKREFFKWIEEHKDEIDWDEDVELGWYYKEYEEGEQLWM